MIDGFILLAPLLVLPIVLMLAVWGCTFLFPFGEPPLLLPLTVEALFQPPADADIGNLVVTIEISGVTVDGDDVHEPDQNRNPELQDDGTLLYVSEFPATPEGTYTVVCDVYDMVGLPIIRRPAVDCVVEVSGELGGDFRIHFEAGAGESVFTCGGV